MGRRAISFAVKRHYLNDLGGDRAREHTSMTALRQSLIFPPAESQNLHLSRCDVCRSFAIRQVGSPRVYEHDGAPATAPKMLSQEHSEVTNNPTKI